MCYISVTYPDGPKLKFLVLVGIGDGQMSGILPSFNFVPATFLLGLFIFQHQRWQPDGSVLRF